MEEDIKILRELIKSYRDCGLDDYPSLVLNFTLHLSEIKALENILNTLDNIEREIISRTDKLTAAYKKIDKLKKNNDRKQKIIEKKQRIINELDKEAQSYFDDMLELSYKLQSKEDLLKAIMKY